MKKILFAVFALIGAYFIFRESDDFSLARITHDHPYDARWDVHPLKPEEKSQIKKILTQKYNYFGAGAQAYIFFSEDQNYVLKFLKRNRVEAPRWIRMLPLLPYQKKKIAHKENSLIKDYTSYKLAFDVLQEETGLLVVHLNPSNDLEKKITLVDGKKTYEIDLDHYDFILQKKGELVYSAIDGFLQKNDIRNAKIALNSLLQFFQTRIEKRIADREPNLAKNFAFIGTRAVQIDIGRFSSGLSDPPSIRKDFKEWLGARSPELLTYFEEQYDYFFPETRAL